jgi:hypothetical protein
MGLAEGERHGRPAHGTPTPRSPPSPMRYGSASWRYSWREGVTQAAYRHAAHLMRGAPVCCRGFPGPPVRPCSRWNPWRTRNDGIPAGPQAQPTAISVSGIAVDRPFNFSVQYRDLCCLVLLMSPVANREQTHEAHSNRSVRLSSLDALRPDPYPFLGEAAAADPCLISSLGEEPPPLPPEPQTARFWVEAAKSHPWHPSRPPSVAPHNRDGKLPLYRPL